MRYIFALAFSFIFCSGFSQNENDALRYSMIQFGGTARFVGMAGSMGALGADASCASTNPAGYGRFTRSEFSLGLNYLDAGSKVSFNGTESQAGRGNFNVSQFALIGAFKPSYSEDWKQIQFGVSYERYALFHNRISINGENNSSLLDAFVGEANGVAEQYLLADRPFYSGPAYWAYLIDPLDTIANTYISAIPDGRVEQTRTIDRKGSIGETNFTLSGNYLDKLYFGGSLGFPKIRYTEKYDHEERPLDTSNALNSFTFSESLVTGGLGINFKVGIIFQPVEWLRLGLALHTASAFGLSDRWSTSVSSDFKGGENPDYQEYSVLGSYNYRLRTPGRAIFSLGIILLKQGSISVDYERVNYSNSKMRPDRFDLAGYSFNEENQAIKNSFRSASNLRIGAEWRIKPIYLRAGYALYGQPYKSGIVLTEPQRTLITGGIGYRNRIFYVDLAYMNMQWKEDYYMYNPALTNAATFHSTIHSFILSGGINF